MTATASSPSTSSTPSTAKPALSPPRPGKRPSGAEATGVLKHVIGRMRHNWPRVGITARGDGHYGTPEVMDLLEDRGRGYIFGLPGNVRLTRIGRPWREDVAVRRVRSAKDQARRFFQTGYRAKSWSRERAVIARVEATSKGTDIRFVVRIARLRHDVTNLPGRAKVLYDKIYCARGRMENMIKEHKLYTKSDRTSCHRWEASQFRLFRHTGAYWLLHQLRQAAPRRSPWRKATFETPRRASLKVAARIKELKSRVRVALPSAIHTGKPSCRWRPASPPKAPEPGGMCRRINPEHQPPTSPKIYLERRRQPGR